MPNAGVPLKVAVPFPLSTKDTPLGNAPDSLRLAVGNPVVVTVKLPRLPSVKVVLLALLIVGAWLTVCDTPEEVLPLKLLSPAYVAVRVLAPALVRVNEH